MLTFAFAFAAAAAGPATAEDYAAMKARVSSSVGVAMLFMDGADHAFNSRDIKEGCRQLRLARKELISAGLLLNTISGMQEADSSTEERSEVNSAVRQAQSILADQNGILEDRCRDVPE